MVIAVVGSTFDNALAAAMYHARSVHARMSAKSDIVSIPSSLGVRPQWRESWYDGLGYCKAHDLLASLHYTKPAQVPGTRLVLI